MPCFWTDRAHHAPAGVGCGWKCWLFDSRIAANPRFTSRHVCTLMLALASATDAASFMLSSASQTWKASESNNVAPIPVPAMPDRSCFLIPEATSVNAWIDAGECFGPSAASTIRMLLLRCVGNEGQSVRARGTWVQPKSTCSGIEGRRAHAEQRPAADWCRGAIGTPFELVNLPRRCAR